MLNVGDSVKIDMFAVTSYINGNEILSIMTLDGIKEETVYIVSGMNPRALPGPPVIQIAGFTRWYSSSFFKVSKPTIDWFDLNRSSI